jgi:hypothetical protein
MAGPLCSRQRSNGSRTSGLRRIPVVLGTGSEGQSLAIRRPLTHSSKADIPAASGAEPLRKFRRCFIAISFEFAASTNFGVDVTLADSGSS